MTENEVMRLAIQWFPGHMAKARRQIEEKLKLIDVAIELIDARIPKSSRNPMIDDILRDKPRLVLMNKADLADPRLTDAWTAYFRGDGLEALPVNSLTGHPGKEIVSRCKRLLAKKTAAMRRKGLKPRAIRALIVGIPNVGKSTLINRLAGRKAAATGDRPGVTKAQQWIKVGTELELLDTPGILWPKFDDPGVGLRLAATGAIKDDILHPEEIALYVLALLADEYPHLLKERFGFAQLPDGSAGERSWTDLLEEIGRKRGCLLSGGAVDREKAAGLVLHDLRTGKFGRVTLERPDEA